MENPITDHPHLRATLVCPLCHGAKDQGLIACWTCYRRFNFRTGLAPAIARILEDEERTHSAPPAPAHRPPRFPAPRYYRAPLAPAQRSFKWS